MLEPIVMGAIGGVAWSVLGYVRNKEKDKKTKFDMFGFVKPVVIGLAIGAYAGYTGQIGNFDLVATGTVMTPIVAVIDKLVNIAMGLIKK